MLIKKHNHLGQPLSRTTTHLEDEIQTYGIDAILEARESIRRHGHCWIGGDDKPRVLLVGMDLHAR